eukprot:TRINITY_DN49990_c0_g1_i1.p1 TRINITY_DN49990_c0_g1~~TRINITY_DN49990_c0_g1_i1.p1  ORF type:complete len:331 (+),score=26.23 TRINITY_DN49990_c0_g1_i1:172-1164(+)
MVAALIFRINVNEDRVKQAALNFFKATVKRGDVCAASILIRYVTHACSCVREVAIELLASAVEAGDDRAIDALTACLKDSKAGVRSKALVSLSTLVDKAEASIVVSVTEHVKAHFKAMLTRYVALIKQSFGVVLAADSALTRFIKAYVVEFAVAVIALRTVTSDVYVSAFLSRPLRHESACIRICVLRAMRNSLLQGIGGVVAAVMRMLTDSVAHVRETAISTLKAIGKGHDSVIVALVERLEDDVSSVRWAAVDALKTLSQSRERYTIDLAIPRLEHSSPVVRRAALDLLKELTPKGDDTTILAIKARLQDEKEHIRWAASDVLSVLEV